jgi:hypothetical protein
MFKRVEGTRYNQAPFGYRPQRKEIPGMVVYNLICANDHPFEGWFNSAETYDSQQESGSVLCPVCGSHDIQRRPTAAYLNTKSPVAASSAEERQAVAMASSHPAVLWAKMVEYIRRNSEDVGRDFPEQARKIHYREIPGKNIRGTASQSEIEELGDEGIEVFPIPAGIEIPDKLQ